MSACLSSWLLVLQEIRSVFHKLYSKLQIITHALYHPRGQLVLSFSCSSDMEKPFLTGDTSCTLWCSHQESAPSFTAPLLCHQPVHRTCRATAAASAWASVACLASLALKQKNNPTKKPSKSSDTWVVAHYVVKLEMHLSYGRCLGLPEWLIQGWKSRTSLERTCHHYSMLGWDIRSIFYFFQSLLWQRP